jgi:hypothetical protein
LECKASYSEEMMPGLFNLVRWQTIDGPSVEGPFGRVTPEARSFVIRFPFGGFAWTKPVAVRIERGGTTERLGIPDPTRRAQVWLIVAVAVLLALVAVRSGSRRKDSAVAK